MDQDLSAELAQLEAQLAQDDQLRSQLQNQHQPQQQQQQQQAPETSVFPLGVPPSTQQQPQQQQQQQPVHAMNPFAQSFQPSNTSPFPDGPFPPSASLGTTFTGIGQGFPAQPVTAGLSASAAQAAAQAAAAAHSFSKDTDGRSVFVGNLPKGENGGPTTTPEALVQFFSDCGPILNCTVLKDRTTGELKGTAYIEFQTYTAMGQAIDTKNNADFKGSSLIVTKKRSNYRADRARGSSGRGGRFDRPRRDAGHPMDPFQAITALMGLMNGAAGGRGGFRGTYRGRGGRGGGRGTGEYRGGAGGGRAGNEESGGDSPAGNASGSFQPF